MPKKRIALALLAGVAALCLVTWANAVAPGPEPLAPFTGVIKNNTKDDMSVYSQNSLGTLIIPARGWIEFVVWEEKFDLRVYKDGEPYFAQKMAVTPQAIPFMTQNYDFIAEINPPPPPKQIKKYYKKKRYKKYRGKRRRKPC